LQGYNQPVAITAVTATTIKLLVLTLEAYEKRRILRLEYQTVPPEVTSGIFTRWFFWWQIPLFKLGYGHVLAIEDLFTLDKHLGTTYLHKSINAAWSRCQSPHNARWLLSLTAVVL
jgi:ATP-binding cassette subfamily C (CFTR/MRP) protein 1